MPPVSTPEESAALTAIHARARQQQQRIIFPEQSDPRVQQALQVIADRQACKTLVLKAGPGDKNSEVFLDDPNAREWSERAEAAYAASMQNKNLNTKQLREQLSDPLLLSTVLVGIGYADGGVAGSTTSTANVLRACLNGIGLASDTKLLSSTFLIDHEIRLMTFGDCAVNPEPDAAQLAQIAMSSAETHHLLTGTDPLVALLSFSTLGSASHASVKRVLAALDIVKKQAPELAVNGELQFDSAVVAEVAKEKTDDSSVAGNANVLIFPDLNSANIGYKIAERLGGATAIGPILQGLRRPWIDLSRGCDTGDIVNAAAIASILSTALPDR